MMTESNVIKLKQADDSQTRAVYSHLLYLPGKTRILEKL